MRKKDKEIRNLFIDLIELLLDYGYQINEINPSGFLLLTCCFREALELLIQYGIDIDAQDSYGNTILHEMVQTNNVEIIEILLKHGANIHLKNKEGEKAYDYINNFSNNAQQIEALFTLYGNIEFKDTSAEKELDKSTDSTSNIEDPNNSKMLDLDYRIIQELAITDTFNSIISEDSDIDPKKSESNLDQFSIYIHTLNEDGIAQLINSLNEDLQNSSLSEVEHNLSKSKLMTLLAKLNPKSAF